MDRGAGDKKRLALRKEQPIFDSAESINLLDLPTEMLLMILEELLKIDPVTLLGSVPRVSRQVRALTLGVRGNWPEKPLGTRLAGKLDEQVEQVKRAMLSAALRRFPKTTELSELGKFKELKSQLDEAGIVPAVAHGIFELLKPENINKFNHYGDTPLFIACEKAYFEVVRFLLENGADVNIADKYGRTALSEACKTHGSSLDIVRLLVEKGADVNGADNRARTPLSEACRHYNLEIVKLLAEKGANVNIADDIGRTPLHEACFEFFQLDKVQLLITLGADVNIADDLGQTPLYIACQHARLGEKGHLGIVKFLLEKGADTNKADNKGQTPLSKACQNGHLDIVRLLVEKGADINKADKDGVTPLDIAHGHKYLAVAQFLKDNGAVIGFNPY